MEKKAYEKCLICKKIINGNFSNLKNKSCDEECQTYQTISYLEHCLIRNIIPDELYVLINHESTLIRELCQKISKIHNLNMNSKFKKLINDPSSTIRAKYIEEYGTLNEVLESIEDENKCVRLAVLKRLKSFKYSSKYVKKNKKEICDEKIIVNGLDEKETVVSGLYEERSMAELENASNSNTENDNKENDNKEIGNKDLNDLIISNRRKIYGQKQEKILGLIGEYINDKDEEVRMEFSRTLGIFRGCSTQFINKLFDKKMMGLFIYGAEDEYDCIRAEIVRAVKIFANKETINEIVRYLIDLLNDESEVVRKAVLKVCILFSKKFELEIDVEQLSYILDSISHNQGNLKKGVLLMICRCKYKTTDVLNEIVEQRHMDEDTVFKVTKKIVSLNHKLFYESLSQFYDYDVENRKEFSLLMPNDIEYLRMLIILFVLENRYTIKIDQFTRRNLLFIKRNFDHLKSYKKYERTRNIGNEIIQILKSNNNIDFVNKKKKIEYLFKPATDVEYLFSYLFDIYKESCEESMNNNSKKLFDKLFFMFFFKNKKINNKFQKKMENYNNLKNNICKVIKWIIKKKLCNKIKTCKYEINVPEEIHIWIDTGIDISVFLKYTYEPDNTYFVIENEKNQKISYKLRETINIILNDPVESITCYIETTKNNKQINLSEKKTIKIIKDTLSNFN